MRIVSKHANLAPRRWRKPGIIGCNHVVVATARNPLNVMTWTTSFQFSCPGLLRCSELGGCRRRRKHERDRKIEQFLHTRMQSRIVRWDNRDMFKRALPTRFHLETYDGNPAAPIVLTDACGFRFPETCSRLRCPETSEDTPRNGNDRAGSTADIGKPRRWHRPARVGVHAVLRLAVPLPSRHAPRLPSPRSRRAGIARGWFQR